MKDLTPPRYLVIADYPNSHYEIGQIIELSVPKDAGGWDMVTLANNEEIMPKYPHLFRLLHWWEYRDEKEMPEYVRFESLLGIEKPSYEHIVAWDMNNENGFIAINKDVRKFHHNAITPATLNEYNEYIKNK